MTAIFNKLFSTEKISKDTRAISQAETHKCMKMDTQSYS